MFCLKISSRPQPATRHITTTLFTRLKPILTILGSTLFAILVVISAGTSVPVSAAPQQAPVQKSVKAPGSFTGLVYEQDCNDPDGPLPTWMCREFPQQLRPPDYPYYVGHDEPEIQLFSNTPGSGNNLQWKIQLPQTDPTPKQDGSVIANRELYPTFWFSLALCDPASKPFNPCTPNSDTNASGGSNPAAAGSAILELQFYPPGSSCTGDDSKWCASMTIDELTTNCGEPITAAPITTDGTPGGPRLLMSPGDKILITIKDTANGLENDVVDLTSSASGSMVASTANGFTQTLETTHAQLASPPPAGTCSTTPFAYHPEFLTASTANTGSWIFANVNLSFEIGHWELCKDAECTSLPDPPEPSTSEDDNGCGTVLGVGGCTGQDNDRDGTSYLADWPDGSASHPSTLIIGNPADNGIGPFSFSNGSYQSQYGQIFFQPANTSGPFYPFFSQAGTGSSCVLNFGNDIPGVTTNDLGKTAQYGTSINNPCTAPVAQCKDVTVPADPNVCSAASASIDNGSFDFDLDHLTFSQSPSAPYSLGTTPVKLTVSDTASLTNSCSAKVTVEDLQAPSVSCPSPVIECTSPSGAPVTLNPVVSDNCPGVVDLGCTPPSGSTFSLGTTPFSCKARDASGNNGSCSSNVVVRDTTSPAITGLSANPPVLWPPNHTLVPVSVSVSASDTCDAHVSCKIVSVTSNEPVLGPGSGNTNPDWIISSGTAASPANLGLQLRAERDGGGTGRVYTIAVDCSDASGNTAHSQTTVTVPHDQRP